MADEGYQPFPDIAAWAAVPFDPTTYDQYAALLEQARAEATEEAREHAVRTAMRYAGTDTGAIEGLYTTDRGFTRTVAIEAAGWEAAANERGPNAAAVIKDQIEAYEWVLDLVTESRPVTEHVIRELHTLLCRSQDTYVVHTEVGPQEQPLPKGQYKTLPNNPTSLATGKIHHYAPPDMVAPEMARLVASLSSDEYLNAHPVVQAAYLHYSFVAIHPFADGNGRVSRALASVPLYRALRVPLIVFRDQRDAYLDALGEADRGNLGPLVAFVNDAAADTADLVRTTAGAGPAADNARSLEALHKARLTSGFTDDELDAIAQRVLAEIEHAARRELESLEWPPGVVWRVDMADAGDTNPPTLYRWPSNLQVLMLIRSDAPAAAEAYNGAQVAVATAEGVEPIRVEPIAGEPLALPARDFYGGVRDVAKIKIDNWTRHRISVLLHFAAEQAMESRKSR